MLNARQQRFVEEYLIDRNATQAAIRAGYSNKTAKQIGSRLLTVVDVQQAVGECIQKQSERTAIDADYVLNTIRETVERCMQAAPVVRDGKIIEGEYQFEAPSVLKGCELLGRHLALWKERIEITGEVKLVDELKAARERAGLGLVPDVSQSTH